MSLLTRKQTVLAKIETTYGVDSTPDGSTNAMLVKNLNFSPIQSELVSRDLNRPYLGNSQQLLATVFGQADFEVEMVGSGTVGLAPAYDSLLRACGMTKTFTDLTAVINVNSNVATVTLSGHGYASGDKVTITGATTTALNGIKTITKIDNNTFTYPAPGAANETPALGATKVRSAVVYAPVSDNMESVTIYFNNSGVLHKLTGCMGSVEFSVAAKTIPSMKFSFTGLYNNPADVAVPVVDFAAFQVPQIANSQNTPGFSLYSYSACLESASINISNDVQYITMIGCESVKILDRKPAGTLVFEAPLIAQKDYFTIAKDATLGAMSLTHGSKSGFKVKLDAPSIGLGNPSYQDSNGVQMLSAPFTLNPVAGNDELTVTIL